ncbi:MAG TPA: hypothetical protein PLI62_14625 [Spirochaetota bacterium]|nr:hypothetical protein [Spirochaetota bacterium]
MGKPFNRNFIIVIICIVLYFGFVVSLSTMLAIRDAENAADFVFKIFGASMALIFASAGPFGLVGLTVMAGAAQRIHVVAALVFSGCMSTGLTVYVLYRLGAFSLFQ